MSKRQPHDYHQEAERLALLPGDDQAAVVATYRHLAANGLATPACRGQAKAKANALEKLLGLRSKRPAKPRDTSKKGKRPSQPRRKR